jgi:hypothetical protein
LAFHGDGLPLMLPDRTPHIGEYGFKTNAIGDGARSGRAGPLLVQAAGEIADAKCGLLAVVLQHHVTSLGQLGAVLLQAGENSEVALIDHRTAVTLNITGTGRLLLGRSAALLRDGGGGDRQGQQDQSQERFVHSVPSF